MTGPGTTPWAAEGLCRSKWLLRHRAAFNMTIQALGRASVRGMDPAALLAHVQSESVAAPAAIFAAALRQSADFHSTQEGHDTDFVARLSAAAALADAEGGEKGTAPPAPSRTRRLRETLQQVAGDSAGRTPVGAAEAADIYHDYFIQIRPMGGSKPPGA